MSIQFSVLDLQIEVDISIWENRALCDQAKTQ
ncbi:uncharacterized protein METZ01_LOCUS246156 [marine metagenome]|uniref:Uncharacterized protein n=1 Tax=marine metagenome TaxID=408172 RepID=A0A382I1V1_9ZZZZ